MHLLICCSANTVQDVWGHSVWRGARQAASLAHKKWQCETNCYRDRREPVCVHYGVACLLTSESDGVLVILCVSLCASVVLWWYEPPCADHVYHSQIKNSLWADPWDEAELTHFHTPTHTIYIHTVHTLWPTWTHCVTVTQCATHFQYYTYNCCSSPSGWLVANF